VPAYQRARSAFASAVWVWVWCGLKPRVGGCPWPTPLAPASTLLLPHPGSCPDLGASCLLVPFWCRVVNPAQRCLGLCLRLVKNSIRAPETEQLLYPDSILPRIDLVLSLSALYWTARFSLPLFPLLKLLLCRVQKRCVWSLSPWI
jgi:hypothetical protein